MVDVWNNEKKKVKGGQCGDRCLDVQKDPWNWLWPWWLHYLLDVICIMRQNFSLSLVCRHRPTLTSIQRVIGKPEHKWTSLQPLSWPQYLNCPTTVVSLASEYEKSVYLKWLSDNSVWVVSPTNRGIHLPRKLSHLNLLSKDSFRPEQPVSAAAVRFWDFHFLMLPWLSPPFLFSVYFFFLQIGSTSFISVR